MKPWIKEKLDIIDELYSPQRTAASKKRVKAVWNRGFPPDRYPFIYFPLTFNYYNDNHSSEDRLRVTLDELIARGAFHDDLIPTFFPGCRMTCIPGMFGLEAEKYVEGQLQGYFIKDIADIAHLPAPKILPGSTAQQWLDMQKYVLDETDGRLPIHVADMQGPADVCGQLLGYDNLLISAYTDPDAFDRAMSYASEAFILLWNAQKDIAGDAFIGTHLWGWNWIPENKGATISADSIVMVSPDFFDEFYKPYLERLSAELGGLILHSCGNFAHLMPNLMKLSGLNGVNAAQMSVKDLMEAGFNREVTIIAMSDYDDCPEMFDIIRRLELNVDLTVRSFWDGEPEAPISPALWAPDARERLYEKEAALQGWAAITPA